MSVGQELVIYFIPLMVSPLIPLIRKTLNHFKKKKIDKVIVKAQEVGEELFKVLKEKNINLEDFPVIDDLIKKMKELNELPVDKDKKYKYINRLYQKLKTEVVDQIQEKVEEKEREDGQQFFETNIKNKFNAEEILKLTQVLKREMEEKKTEEQKRLEKIMNRKRRRN